MLDTSFFKTYRYLIASLESSMSLASGTRQSPPQSGFVQTDFGTTLAGHARGVRVLKANVALSEMCLPVGYGLPVIQPVTLVAATFSMDCHATCADLLFRGLKNECCFVMSSPLGNCASGRIQSPQA